VGVTEKWKIRVASKPLWVNVQGAIGMERTGLGRVKVFLQLLDKAKVMIYA